MILNTSVVGVSWRIVIPSGFPRISVATTLDHTTRFQGGGCPDSVSLAHEFYHVLHTSWLRYLLSYTLGRLWGDSYWRDEENDANHYGAMHETDADFLAIATQIRGQFPDWPTVRITHS